MKKLLYQDLIIVITALIYLIFFWGEQMGLNSLLFAGLMIAILYIQDTEIRQSRAVLLTTAGTLLTAFWVVLNNSMMSKTIHLLSFASLVGFAKQRELRFLGFAFLLSLVQLVKTPLQAVKHFSPSQTGVSRKLAPLFLSFRLSLLPLFVLLVFYFLYYISNPQFSQLSNSFWTYVLTWFNWDISIEKILFFLSGLLICTAIISQTPFPFFKNIQTRLQEQLVRKRILIPNRLRGMIGLKNQYRRALIMIFSLNCLLFIVNLTDINYLWFNSSEILQNSSALAFEVHTGTYFLIASILLAVGILLLFFNQNLNFYPQNRLLKIGAYLWIIQNGILALSLFLRNYYYISVYGLAYKRIGILIFLLLVTAGLVTLWLKISQRRTNYFLLHRNAWVLYYLMITLSAIPWDSWITRYNLSRETSQEIDFLFLNYTVSDKNLSILIDFEKENPNTPNLSRTLISSKKAAFLRRKEYQSWLSWNYSDYKIQQYLKESID